MRFSVTLAAIAALGLTACNESTPATDGATTTGDPAASAPAAPVAGPTADMEGPAAGKWRITMSTGGMTLPPTETCYTKQTSLAEAQKTQADAGVTCGEQTFRREGGAVIGHYICTMSTGMKVTTDMRVTGDFNTKYTMDMTNQMDPPPAPGMGEQKMTMTAERIGDC